jgi:hypothetical protein
LNGTGRYSLFDDKDRGRVLSLRRVRSGLLVLAILLAVIAPVVWLYSGGHIYWSRREPVFGVADALVQWLLPALALTGSLFVNIARLRGVAGPLRRHPGSASLAPIADIRKDLASVWLHSAGLSPSLGSRELSVWAIPTATSAMVIALLLAIGIILSVVFKSTARMIASTAEARVWIQEASSAASAREVRPPSPRAALALATDPDARRRPGLSGSVGLSEAKWEQLELAKPAAYCLSPREVLFGPTAIVAAFFSSGEAQGSGLDTWRDRALEVFGFGGLRRRSMFCSSVLGPDVTTVDPAE